MKRKYYFVILFLVLAIFLSGCSGGGIVTPDIDEIGGDAYLCENLLKGFYTALSNRSFAQEHPTFYVTYQVNDVYDFSYLGGNLELYYDYSWTTPVSTSYLYGRRMVFEEINGEWKMS